MNVIVRLEFEHAYNDSAVQRFNDYTTRTPKFEGTPGGVMAEVLYNALDGKRFRT